MNLSEVMDEVATALRAISGLRVFAYPPDKIKAPAAVVTLPDEITFDATYGRGSDTMTLPVMVMVDLPTSRTARDRIAGYVAGSGPTSVKAAVEGHRYLSCSDVTVKSVEFDTVTYEGVPHVAATFTLDITGSGGA